MLPFNTWMMPTALRFMQDERTYYFCIKCGRYFASDRFSINCGCF